MAQELITDHARRRASGGLQQGVVLGDDDSGTWVKLDATPRSRFGPCVVPDGIVAEAEQRCAVAVTDRGTRLIVAVWS